MAKWGDDDFDEFDDESLPDQQITIDGDIKTIKDFTYDDFNKKVVVTTRYKVKSEKVIKPAGPEVDRRRKLARFGAAVGEGNNQGITMATREDILMERVRLVEASNEEKKVEDLQAALMSNDKTKVVGSLRDVLYKKRMERQLLAAKGLIDAPEKPPDEDSPMQPGKGGYVPPAFRSAGGGTSMEGESMFRDRRRDENSVRITNLSEDTREEDLQELFRPFGSISRVYIAYDRETNVSRGFGFVNFHDRADAQRAIERLDGHGYDNLILRVEFAAPRPERQMA